MNFPLYSPTALAAGLNAGYRDLLTLCPLPDIPKHLFKPLIVRSNHRNRPQQSRAQIISQHPPVDREGFPFRLVWEALSSPAVLGVGLVEADVTHRCLIVELLQPQQ